MDFCCYVALHVQPSPPLFSRMTDYKLISKKKKNGKWKVQGAKKCEIFVGDCCQIA